MKTDNENYWKNYKNNSTAISKADLDNVWQNYPKIADSQDPKKLLIELDTIMATMCKVYYGIPEQFISKDLIKAVCAEITKKHNQMTLQDIQHAFDRAIITPPKNWKSVTKQELMAPIVAWTNYKEKIKQDFNNYKRQQHEEEKRAAEAEKFRQDSIAFYNECVDNLEWTGTIFQASAIRKDLNKHFEQEKKQEIWEQAQEQYAKTEEAINDAKRRGITMDMNTIGYSAKRLYSEMLVREGIQNGIKL